METIKNTDIEEKAKFHEGDWITFTRKDGTREVLQVSDIIDGRYYFNHLLHFSWSIKECNKICHLWNIQEARDGDVLADDIAILLFRSIGNRNWKNVISYYVILETNLNNRFSISDNEEYWGKVEDCELKPATKEQRNTLMKAMADAGYTFDFKEKELKKIKQKLSWSEEDEKILKEIITDVRFEGYNNDLQANSYRKIRWLKTLKDRVLLQPKQGCKQENTGDLTDFENAMMHIGGSFFGDNAGLDPNDTNVIKEQANLLLELVPSKEWSEDDESRMNNLCHFLKEYGEQYYGYLTLQDTIHWLKSLRPQKQRNV